MLQDLVNGAQMIVAGATVTAIAGVGITDCVLRILLLVSAVLAATPITITWYSLVFMHAAYWND